MKSAAASNLREIITPCVRLVNIMLSIDNKLGILIIICWLFGMVQEVVLVWIESQTRTALQQLLMNVEPRENLFPRLIRLWGQKLAFLTFFTGCRWFQRDFERRIKKKMREKMTLLLLDSFCSLDFVTQSNGAVIREFSQADELIQGSIIRRVKNILDVMCYSGRFVFVCISLAIQTRRRGELILLPVLAMVVGLEALILHSTWISVGLHLEQGSKQADRQTRRNGGKTRNHRRRNDLRFPFKNLPLNREIVLRGLGSWIISEYKKASEAIMLGKTKVPHREQVRGLKRY